MTYATKARDDSKKFWGWGKSDFELLPQEIKELKGMIGMIASGDLAEISEPQIADYELRAPRVNAPGSLQDIVSDTPYDRLCHSYGQSFADVVRMLMRSVPNPPDLVAFPKTEQDVADLLDWGSSHNVAVIPFGGGSSVCGGVESDVGDSYAGVVTMDLQYLDKVVEIDRTSRAARIQAGVYGPALEDQLRPHGLTLRHFPQSFEYSTLGGWIVTRAGGHYASLYTHIDDFVESTRSVTPAGILETRRLPGSGAGVSGDRMMLGSEGSLGVVTEAWMRLQDKPTFRASASVAFDDYHKAAETVRMLSQSGLFPTNCRLLDSFEVMLNNVGDRQSPTLVLGFESADHPLQPWMERALELVRDHGGRYDEAAAQRSMAEKGSTDNAEHRKGAAGAWREAFIRMPYRRDLCIRLGLIVDTFETAITWDKFPDFYENVRTHMMDAILRITGKPALVTCRFTHVYPDGPAPYFTIVAHAGTDSLERTLDHWCQIKLAANDAVTRFGGTVTHHHAVGRDHRTGYEVQSSPLLRKALTGAKQELDPAGILNPGVLYDPKDRDVGIRGVLKDYT